MALDTQAQIREQLQKASSVLVTFKQDYNGDALGSSLALARTLEKQGKRVDLVCQDFQVSKKLSFLPGTEQVQTQLPQREQRHQVGTVALRGNCLSQVPQGCFDRPVFCGRLRRQPLRRDEDERQHH